MAYITTAHLAARVGSTLYARLTDRVSGASADAAVAQQIVDEAEAEANSYLAPRYATPVEVTAGASVANVLEARVLDLAEFIAWKSSPFVSSVPDRIRTLYEAAGAWFRAVARGEIDLPAAAPLTGPAAENDAPRFVAAPRVFTADELDGL